MLREPVLTSSLHPVAGNISRQQLQMSPPDRQSKREVRQMPYRRRLNNIGIVRDGHPTSRCVDQREAWRTGCRGRRRPPTRSWQPWTATATASWNTGCPPNRSPASRRTSTGCSRRAVRAQRLRGLQHQADLHPVRQDSGVRRAGAPPAAARRARPGARPLPVQRADRHPDRSGRAGPGAAPRRPRLPACRGPTARSWSTRCGRSTTSPRRTAPPASCRGAIGGSTAGRPTATTIVARDDAGGLGRSSTAARSCTAAARTHRQAATGRDPRVRRPRGYDRRRTICSPCRVDVVCDAARAAAGAARLQHLPAVPRLRRRAPPPPVCRRRRLTET